MDIDDYITDPKGISYEKGMRSARHCDWAMYIRQLSEGPYMQVTPWQLVGYINKLTHGYSARRVIPGEPYDEIFPETLEEAAQFVFDEDYLQAVHHTHSLSDLDRPDSVRVYPFDLEYMRTMNEEE